MVEKFLLQYSTRNSEVGTEQLGEKDLPPDVEVAPEHCVLQYEAYFLFWHIFILCITNNGLNHKLIV